MHQQAAVRFCQLSLRPEPSGRVWGQWVAQSICNGEEGRGFHTASGCGADSREGEKGMSLAFRGEEDGLQLIHL